MDKENVSFQDHNELIIKFLSGNASAEEIELLSTWVNDSKENREEFIKMKTAWMVSAQSVPKIETHALKSLSTINRKLDFHENTPKQPYFNVRRLFKIAAAFIIVCLLSSLTTYFVMNGRRTDNLGYKGLVFFSAPKGSKAMTILPDGTQVWLNAGSDLCYDINTYGKKTREVTLIGQGFFKVIPNAQKPFVVSAKNLKIKALGTEFDVKAYPEEDIVETTLVKGKVNVEGKDKNKHSFTITMKPKQKVTYYTGQAEIETSMLNDPSKINVDKLNHIKLSSVPPDAPEKPQIKDIEKTDLYTSWKDDRWVFEGVELGDLAVLLERRFNVSIEFNTDELKHYKFTGIFRQETLEQILKVLKLTAPLSYSVGKGKVELMLDPDLKIKYKKYMKF
jgi:ferric-dicitrate binding protein FerR (iron transport regulator)